jgi:hypothetical protein
MLGGVCPAGMPVLSVLLADFSCSSAASLAATFGVSRSTAHRWLKANQAPRSVMLALYLAAPSYGQREAHNRIEHAYEGRRLALQLADSLRAHTTALERELARMLAVADFGSANAPVYSAPTAAELLARPVTPRRALSTPSQTGTAT